VSSPRAEPKQPLRDLPDVRSGQARAPEALGGTRHQ